MNDDKPLATQITMNLTKSFKTVVSPKDADLCLLRWCVSASANRQAVYAYRAIPGDNKKKEYLGRVILARKLGLGRPLAPGETCLYKDKNSLNNTRENLELKIKNVNSKAQL